MESFSVLWVEAGIFAPQPPSHPRVEWDPVSGKAPRASCPTLADQPHSLQDTGERLPASSTPNCFALHQPSSGHCPCGSWRAATSLVDTISHRPAKPATVGVSRLWVSFQTACGPQSQQLPLSPELFSAPGCLHWGTAASPCLAGFVRDGVSSAD